MYTVIWLDAALDDLADLYVAADPANRERMAAGLVRLNRRLADHPQEEGESREGSYRLAFADLLAIRFRVEFKSMAVRVTRVYPYGR